MFKSLPKLLYAKSGDFVLALIEQFETLVVTRLTKVSTLMEQGLNSLLVRASVGTLAENDLALEV